MSAIVTTSGHPHVTRRARAAVVVEEAAPRSGVRVVARARVTAEVAVVPRQNATATGRGWFNLHGEVVVMFGRFGAVDLEDGRLSQ